MLVVTNQACVARGELCRAGLAAIYECMRSGIEAAGGRIDDIFVCTHGPDDGCACRKPKPQLIHDAQRAWGFAPHETWFVGDARREVEAALAAGCRPALVLTGQGQRTAQELPNVPTYASLQAFVEALVL